jgi:hypothetical protein
MATYRSEKEFLHSLKRFNALSSQKYEWYTGMSEKQHTCEFGHEIPPHNLYFKKPLDLEGEQKLRICKHCMEKLVFVTVDSDLHAREVTEHLYRQEHPPRRKSKHIRTH